MTDEEYRELLSALAVKHLQPGVLLENLDALRSELNRLSWICRLNELIRGLPPQLQHHIEMLVGVLSEQLLESPTGFCVTRDGRGRHDGCA